MSNVILMSLINYFQYRNGSIGRTGAKNDIPLVTHNLGMYNVDALPNANIEWSHGNYVDIFMPFRAPSARYFVNALKRSLKNDANHYHL